MRVHHAVTVWSWRMACEHRAITASWPPSSLPVAQSGRSVAPRRWHAPLSTGHCFVVTDVLQAMAPSRLLVPIIRVGVIINSAPEKRVYRPHKMPTQLKSADCRVFSPSASRGHCLVLAGAGYPIKGASTCRAAASTVDGHCVVLEGVRVSRSARRVCRVEGLDGRRETSLLLRSSLVSADMPEACAASTSAEKTPPAHQPPPHSGNVSTINTSDVTTFFSKWVSSGPHNTYTLWNLIHH